VGDEVVRRERVRRRAGKARTHRRDGAAAGQADGAAGIGRVPGRQEVVGLVATGGEVVFEADLVSARREAFEREPERDDATFRIARGVAVQVAVLRGMFGVPRLIAVDWSARASW